MGSLYGLYKYIPSLAGHTDTRVKDLLCYVYNQNITIIMTFT